MALVPCKTNATPSKAVFAATGSGGGTSADPKFSTVTVAGTGSVSSLVTNFALTSTLFTGGISGINPNTTITFMSSIAANTTSLSTLYSQDIQAPQAEIGAINASTLTINEVVTIPGVFSGGINFNKLTTGAALSVPDNNTLSLISHANFDTNLSTTNCLASVGLGTYPPPLGQYDALSDFAVGRLLVGGPFNGIGTDIQISGPKPFISAVNTDWTNVVPPSAASLYNQPLLQMSPFATTGGFVSTLIGPNDGQLTITNGNGAAGSVDPTSTCVRIQAASWTTAPASTFFTTNFDVGSGAYSADILATVDKDSGFLINTNLFEVTSYTSNVGPPNPNSAIYFVDGYNTKVYNNGGVGLGVDFNCAELSIPSSSNVVMNGNLAVSSINSFAPAYVTGAQKDVTALFSTLFAANPSLSTIVY